MKLHFKCFYGILFILFGAVPIHAQQQKTLLEQGWQELVKDNDTTALRYFNLAYTQAKKQNDVESAALALLRMGICYYGVSYSKGMQYAQLAMQEYKKMEGTQPLVALEGRSRCLQLISTINSRRGKYREAIALSHQAKSGFPINKDTTTYLGLIYHSLGSNYQKIGMADSAAYYLHLALRERERTHDLVYLPASYVAVGDRALAEGNATQSLQYYQKAQAIADSSKNRQAQVSVWISIGRWQQRFSPNASIAEGYFKKALDIAATLTDKSFLLKALNELSEVKKQQGDYKTAYFYKERIDAIKDSLHSWDSHKAAQILEVQFDIAEKNRQLELAQKEKAIARLTNYLLIGFISVITIIALAIVFFLKRINKRDKQLLKTKEELVRLTEDQKRLRELQMQNEIEFRESQLSAMTLQMVQKNELLQELKLKLEEGKSLSQEQALHKIINKGLSQDQEWSDFNSSFESVNKNFYTRIKQAYPDISPNDLKICALIKMNLSIKEMAAILNISPDSVKTARYRLRKKLQLNTEDNLTDFILQL